MAEPLRFAPAQPRVLRTRRRLALWLLVAFLGVLVAPLGAVFAEDEKAEDVAIEAERPAEKKPLTEADLTKRMFAKPKALWALVLSRALPILIGLGLLLFAWSQRIERKRLGPLPPPPPVVLAQPFELGQSMLLWAAGFFVVPSLVLWFYAGVAGTPPFWVGIAGVVLGSVSAAVLVVMRRHRLVLQAADARGAAAASEPAASQADASQPEAESGPTLPPGMLRAVGLGLRTVCYALLIATPLAFLWALALRAVTGGEGALQDVVSLVIDPASTYEPWLIAVFGVFVAPFTEEVIFRALLYPALRATLVRALGNERRAVWIAAVAVSAFFAGIHQSWLAAVPLFALAMVLTWVYEKTHSLGACVVAHGMHNALSMIPLLMLRF